MQSLKAVIVGISALMFLTGCEAPRENSVANSVSFSRLPKINLNVARIEVNRIYKAPLMAPNVEHEMPEQLIEAADRWISDRLRAVGTYGVATLSIDKASVVEVKLKKTEGIHGVFINDQVERYDVVLSIGIVISKFASHGQAAARTTVRASRTISENASIFDREQLWQNLNNQVMVEFNQAFEARLRRHLGPYLR